MKSIIKSSLIIICLSLWAAQGHAQQFIPLADSIGKWSEVQLRPSTMPNGPMIEVSTKVIKHFGTTGIIEVKITNRSEKVISGRCGLKQTKGDLNDNIVHVNNAYNLGSLKPNYYVIFKMELRECMPKGRKNMDDLQKIAACQPRLLFPTGWLEY